MSKRLLLISIYCLLLSGCTGQTEANATSTSSDATTIGTFETAAGVQEKEILVGVSLDLSDEESSASAAVTAFEWQIEELNKQDALVGYTVTVEKFDNTGDALTQFQNMETMVAPEGVLLVGLTDGYDETLAIVPTLEQNGMLAVTASNHPDWQGDSLGKNIFSLAEDTNLETFLEESSKEFQTKVENEIADYEPEELEKFTQGIVAAAKVEEILFTAALAGDMTRGGVLQAAG